MDNKLIGAIIVAVGLVLGWVRMLGMKAGIRKERKEQAVDRQEWEEKRADDELEKKQSSNIVDRISDARRRANERRAEPPGK